MKKILIIFAHPAFHKSRINRALASSVKNMEGITFHDLYHNYPDFFIDIIKEQQLLLEHQIIIWHHPFYWFSMPALLKEWMDLVLRHGWAYGENGRRLEGKSVLSVISTGGRRESYSPKGRNHFSMTDFLKPFQQSAQLCHMQYLPPFIVHGSHTMQKKEIEYYAKKYHNVLLLLRDEKINFRKIKRNEYLNDLME